MPVRGPAELEAFYDGRLKPRLEELDGVRRGIRSKAVLGLALAVLAGGAALWALAGSEVPPWVALLPCVAVLGLTAALLAGPYRAYVGRYKGEVLRELVAFLDPGLSYRPEGGLDASTFARCGIFRRSHDRYACEDLVEGAVGSTALRFSEVHAEYKTESTDSKGRRHEQWHDIFRGILFSADFNKHFAGRTYVLTDVAERLLGSLGAALQSAAASHGARVQLEDPEFEKDFAVYSSDQVEARYILSPALMRRILEYKTKAGKAVQLSFVESRVYAAIPYGVDLFEPRLFRTLVDPGPVREYYAALALAFSIVEELNLNTRIWTKA